MMIDDKIQNLLNSKRNPEDTKNYMELTNTRRASTGLEKIRQDNIKDYVKRKVPSGINDLDALLGGGFHHGINIIGAEPGIGKTTLCLQIATNVVKIGIPVIVYSLEQDMDILNSKTLSSELFATYGNDNTCSLSSDDIIGENAYKLNSEQWEAINNAKHKLQDQLKDLIIIDKNVDIDYIAEDVAKYVNVFNKKPLVIVDYIQKLRSPEIYAGNEKASTEHTIKELDSLARILDISIIAISALSRNSYKNSKSISIDSFKETGLIEYSATIILTLEIEDVDENNVKISHEDAMAASPRRIKVRLLKNKNGALNQPITLNYYSKYNKFLSQNEINTIGNENNESNKHEVKHNEMCENVTNYEPKYIKVADEDFENDQKYNGLTLSEIEKIFN